MERILFKIDIVDSCQEAILLAKRTTLIAKIGLKRIINIDLRDEVINEMLNINNDGLSWLLAPGVQVQISIGVPRIEDS